MTAKNNLARWHIKDIIPSKRAIPSRPNSLIIHLGLKRLHCSQNATISMMRATVSIRFLQAFYPSKPNPSDRIDKKTLATILNLKQGWETI
jgi:hypothetical protein